MNPYSMKDHLDALSVPTGYKGDDFGTGIVIPRGPVPNEFIDGYANIVQNVASCNVDLDVHYTKTVLEPLFNEYCAGKLTLDEFVSQLDAKTMLYLKEG